MPQRTLHKWLGIQPPKKVYKKYFYIDWSSRHVPDIAIWLSTKPKKCNFEHKVKWDKLENGFQFTLCGYFPDIDKKYTIKKETKYRNVPYLKSHLQKCVRRQEDTLALKTANHFMKLDIVAFLRRLAIIMLEDSHINMSFINIIWIMVAMSSTPFKIKEYMIEYLLGVVLLITTIDKREFEESFWKEGLPIKNDGERMNSYNKLDDDICSLLYSLTLRKAYGGMKVDMKMIDYFILKWSTATAGDIEECEYLYMEVNPIKNDLESLSLDDWLLEAVDFHCSDILKYIVRRYDFYTEDEVKKMIWHNLSKTNKRIDNEPLMKNEFKRIKKYTTHVQRYLLHCNF